VRAARKGRSLYADGHSVLVSFRRAMKPVLYGGAAASMGMPLLDPRRRRSSSKGASPASNLHLK